MRRNAVLLEAVELAGFAAPDGPVGAVDMARRLALGRRILEHEEPYIEALRALWMTHDGQSPKRAD